MKFSDGNGEDAGFFYSKLILKNIGRFDIENTGADGTVANVSLSSKAATLKSVGLVTDKIVLSSFGSFNTFVLDNASVALGTNPPISLSGFNAADIIGSDADDTITLKNFNWTGVTSVNGHIGAADRVILAADATHKNLTISDTTLSLGTYNANLYSVETFNFTGDNNANVLTYSDWTGSGTFNGNAGSDQIVVNRNGVSATQSFTLNTNNVTIGTGVNAKVVNVSGVEDAQITGGTGNDTFNMVGWNGTATLDGTAGTNDIFNATRNANFTLESGKLTIGTKAFTYSNVDNLNVNGGTGINTYTLKDGYAANLSGIKLSPSFGLDVLKIDNIDVSVTAANAGTNNTITLAGSATASNNRTLLFSQTNSFEGLNLDLSSNAPDTITLTNYPLISASVFKDAKSVAVTRAQNFMLTGTPANGVLKIGSVIGTLTNVGADGLSLTGGANNDIFTISGHWTGPLSLNGAGGSGNALLFTSNAAAIDLNPTTVIHGASTIDHASVQKVTLNGGAAAQNFDVSDWTSGGTINATGGTDTLTLNGKNDSSLTLKSGSLSYGANKWTFSSIENAEITTGDADNTIDAKGWNGTTTIDSGAGNDIIIGGQGADDLDGNSGNDFIYGGNGNDVLVGAGGKDLIVGGDGADKIDLPNSGGENQGNDLLIAGTTLYDNSAATGRTQIDIFNAFRNAWASTFTIAGGRKAVFTTGVTVGGTNHKLSVNLVSTPTVPELNSVLDDGDVDQLDGGTSTGDLGYFENSTGSDQDTVAGFDDFFDVL